MLEEEKQNLQTLFIDQPEIAIQYCVARLCHGKFKTMNEFIEYQKSRGKVSTCQAAWTDGQFSIHCFDCALSPQSCICMECYHKGEHKGHHILYRPYSTGNCDCGDSSLWKQTGFCKEHQGNFGNPDQEEIDPDTLKLMSEIVPISLRIENLVSERFGKIDIVFNWLTEFVKIGDGYRRVISKALIDNECLDFILNSAFNLSKKNNIKIIKFITQFINDSYFISRCINTFHPMFVKLSKYRFTQALNGENSKNVNKYFDVLFHSTTVQATEYTFESKEDWVQLLNEYTENYISYSIDLIQNGINDPKPLQKNYSFYDILLASIKLPEQKPNVQILADKICCNNTRFADKLMYPTRYTSERNTLILQYVLYLFIDNVAECFAKSKNLQCAKPLECMSIYIKECLIDKDIDSFLINEENCTLPPLLERTVDKIMITPIFPLHSMVSTILFTNKENVAEIVRNAPIDIPFDDYIIYFSLISTRYVVAMNLDSLSLLPEESRGMRFIFEYANTFDSSIYMQFNLVQLTAGLIQDKNRYVTYIMKLHKLFIMDDEDLLLLRLSFLIFIGSLITDRCFYYKDDTKRVIEYLTFKLKQNPLTTEDIDREIISYIPNQVELRPIIYQCVKKLTNSIKGRGKTLFRLKDENNWNPVIPIVPLQSLLTIMESHTQKLPDQLMPFPEFLPEPPGYDLHSILLTPSLFCLMYIILHDNHKENESIESVHLVLNLLKLSLQFQKQPLNTQSPIEAANLDELVSKVTIPDWAQKITFNKKEQFSLIDLMIYYEPLSKQILNEIGIIAERAKEETTQEKSHKAMLLKEKIMQEYKSKQNSFTHDSSPIEESQECGVDVEDDAVYQILICQHPVHTKCYSQHFVCPIDRTQSVTILPSIPTGLEDLPNEKYYEAIKQFILSFPEEEDKWCQIVFNCFVSNFVVGEMRLRALPSALDPIKYSILAKNQFYCIWHYIKRNKFEIPEQGTVFRRFVAQMFKCDNPMKEFKETVKSYIISFGGDKQKLYIFLRQCEVFNRLVLLNAPTDKIDWDSILEYESFCEEFDIEFNDEELVVDPFSLIKLPNDYLDLSLPPYECPIKLFSVDTALCLHTGKIIPLHSKNYKHEKLDEYFKKERELDTTLILRLTGKLATELEIAAKDSQLRVFGSCYVDEFGDEDLGLTRCEPLHLNEDKLLEFIDLYLSGEWIYNRNVTYV